MDKPTLRRLILLALAGTAPLALADDVPYTLFTHPDLASRLPGVDGMWNTSDDIAWASEPGSSPNPLGAASYVFDNQFDFFTGAFSVTLGYQVGGYTLADPLVYPTNTFTSWSSAANFWQWSGNVFGGSTSSDGSIAGYALAGGMPSTATATSLLSFSTTIHVADTTSGETFTFGPAFGIALFNDGLRDDIRLIGGDPAGFPGFTEHVTYLAGLLEQTHPEWTAMNFYSSCEDANCTRGSVTVDYSTDARAILPFNVTSGVFTEGQAYSAVIETPPIGDAFFVGDENGGGMQAILGGASEAHDILLIAAGTHDTVGTVLVAGAGSTYTASSGTGVGELGDGRLDISEGAVFTSLNGTQNFVQAPGGFAVANGGGSRGLVQVRDEGSLLGVTGVTVIGAGTVLPDFGIEDVAIGAMHVTAGADVVLDGDLFLGISRLGRGELRVDGPGSSVQLQGAGRSLGIGIEGEGTLVITSGGQVTGAAGAGVGVFGTGTASALIDGSGSLLDTGELLQIGAFFGPPGAPGRAVLTVTNGAMLVAEQVYIATDGVLTGNGGTIIGNVENHGILAPGSSPGVMHIDGDLTLAADGVLLLEIAGLVPGIDYDVLDVSGTLSLGGTLQIVLVDGFELPAGPLNFQFFEAGALVDRFANVDLPEGFRFVLDATGAATIAAVPLPGALVFMLSGLGVCVLSRRR